MRKIQAGCVAWLVNLLGIRWSSSVCRAQVAPIVQFLVLRAGLGGIDSSDKYSACKNAGLKSEFHFLQSIQQTQNKTAKQHRDKIRELVMEFFTATSDKMINTIKQELFDVADGAPIVGRDHPVMQAMMALPAPVKKYDVEHTCMHPSPARAGTARHARMRARRARRACARGMRARRARRACARDVRGVHARACMRARACVHAGARGGGGGGGGGTCAPHCALITCAVYPGELVLFETLKEIQGDKTTCIGSLELPCQRSLHTLLGEIPATPAAPMLSPVQCHIVYDIVC